MPRTRAKIRSGSASGSFNPLTWLMPAKENPNFGAQPEDVPYDFKGDPSKLVQEPYQQPSGWMKFFNPSAAAGVTEANVNARTEAIMQAKRVQDEMAMAREKSGISIAEQQAKLQGEESFKEKESERTTAAAFARTKGLPSNAMPSLYAKEAMRSLNDKYYTEQLEQGNRQTELEAMAPLIAEAARLMKQAQIGGLKTQVGSSESTLSKQAARKAQAPVRDTVEAETETKKATLENENVRNSLLNSPMMQQLIRQKMERELASPDIYPMTAPSYMNRSGAFITPPQTDLKREQMEMNSPEAKLQALLEMLVKQKDGGIQAPSMSLRPTPLGVYGGRQINVRD